MESNFSVDDALADARVSRERLAQRAYSPAWYNPLLGLLLGFFVFSFSWPWEMPWNGVRVAVDVAVALLSGVMAQIYRRRTGLWFSIERVGPGARRVWLGFFAWECLLGGVAALGRLTDYPLVVGGFAGILALGMTIFVGKKLDDAIRADILNGDVDGIMAR